MDHVKKNKCQVHELVSSAFAQRKQRKKKRCWWTLQWIRFVQIQFISSFSWLRGRILTITFDYLDKYFLLFGHCSGLDSCKFNLYLHSLGSKVKFGQIHFEIWTNVSDYLDKYFLLFGRCSGLGSCNFNFYLHSLGSQV